MDTTLLLGLLGSGALFGFIQFLISRHDDKAGTAKRLQAAVDKIAASLNDLREEYKQGRAISARIHIITASDEVKHGVKHSFEWWDQALADIDLYEKYCREHPGFMNTKAEHAIEHIKMVHLERLQKNDFI